MAEKQKNVVEEKAITELTDIIDQDVETIVALRISSERKVSRHQRTIEKATNIVGRPVFFYFVGLFIVLWILVNLSVPQFGILSFDPAPFSWLQGIISLSALLMTIAILITENRQDKITEQRRHLDLQIALLTERKVSKVIELLEELRRDMPTVRNRADPEAEAMQDAVDPHTALAALNETLEVATKELELELEQ